MVSKHLDRKESCASEAVRTRGTLDTVDPFFKVTASVWKSPELSESCEVWGISAEKSTFQRDQTIQKHCSTVCVYVCVCVRAIKKLGFLNETYWGTVYLRAQAINARPSGGSLRAKKNIPYMNTHSAPSFSPTNLFQTCSVIFLTLSLVFPAFRSEPICFLNSERTVKSTAYWRPNEKKLSVTATKLGCNPANNSNI